MQDDFQPSNSALSRAAERFGGNAAGRWMLGQMVCRVAPYFSTISPKVLRIDPGHVEILLKNRRSVQNHIGSVHAIAMCNMAEFLAGTCIDLCVDRRFRWIPVQMTVHYEKIARTDLRGVCIIEPNKIATEGDYVINVDVFNDADERVFRAEVTMRVSKKKLT
ncbi:MAG: hotdog fold domain-containing protein [Polyangiales bacterium]